MSHVALAAEPCKTTAKVPRSSACGRAQSAGKVAAATVLVAIPTATVAMFWPKITECSSASPQGLVCVSHAQPLWSGCLQECTSEGPHLSSGAVVRTAGRSAPGPPRQEPSPGPSPASAARCGSSPPSAQSHTACFVGVHSQSCCQAVGRHQQCHMNCRPRGSDTDYQAGIPRGRYQHLWRHLPHLAGSLEGGLCSRYHDSPPGLRRRERPRRGQRPCGVGHRLGVFSRHDPPGGRAEPAGVHSQRRPAHDVCICVAGAGCQDRAGGTPSTAANMLMNCGRSAAQLLLHRGTQRLVQATT